VTPHAPQLSTLERRSSQPSGQSVWPAPQQNPPEQVSLRAQPTPHAPQFSMSVLRLWQNPEQQACAPGHWFPQRPQLSSSVLVLTHSPPQQV
jgi:hypothetical protein